MVLMIEPISRCIEALKTQRVYDEIIYMTPDAKTLNQSTANTLSLQKNILILTGHYKGVDQRVRDKYITKEVSIGDYVLTGGELAAAVLVDSIVRLIPGVIGDETSALTDSFQDNLLSPPVYTRPSNYEGMKVPEILLSGNFPKIEEWRSEKAYERTQQITTRFIRRNLVIYYERFNNLKKITSFLKNNPAISWVLGFQLFRFFYYHLWA